MDSIGAKIKKIRKTFNLNQVDFSNALGISQGRLSEIEQDKTKPSADTIIALRQVFKVDLNWLLSSESTLECRHELQVKIYALIDELQQGQLEEIIDFIKFKKIPT